MPSEPLETAMEAFSVWLNLHVSEHGDLVLSKGTDKVQLCACLLFYNFFYSWGKADGAMRFADLIHFAATTASEKGLVWFTEWSGVGRNV